MKLSMPRYTFCLISQLTFMFCDLIFNCVSLFPRSRDGLLVLFIFQDLFLILSVTTMLMTFFSTYLFQAGLVEVLLRKFRAAGSVIAAYVAASVLLHCVWLLQKWSDPDAVSTPALIVLFTVHRCLLCCIRAGLVEVLLRKFRAAGSVIAAYVAASVLLHCVWLLQKWSDPDAVSTPALIVLFTLHRCLSSWYYFFYKRAALRVSDPRFYEDIDWITQQLRTH